MAAATEPDKPRKRGNPNGNPAISETTYTPELGAKILAAVQNHHYVESAAALVGVPASTVRNWIRKGRQGHPTLAQFAEDYDRAEAVSEGRLLKVVADAAVDDPKTAMALLERRHRDRWGRNDPHTAQSDQKVTIQLVWPGMNVVDAESMIELGPGIEDAEVVEDGETPGSEL